MDRVSTSLVNLIDATSDIVAAYHPNALQQVFFIIMPNSFIVYKALAN